MQRTLPTAFHDTEIISALLELTSEPIVVESLEGIVLGWSDGAERLTGHTADDVLGRRAAEIYGDIDRVSHRGRCQRLLLDGKPCEFDAVVKTAAGGLRHVRVKLALMRDSAAEPIAIFGNLSAPKGSAARPQASYLPTNESEAVLDSIPVMLAHLDDHRRYQYLNKTGSVWLGVDQSEVLGRHIRDVMGAENYELLLPHIDAVLSGVDSAVEISIRKPGGGIRHSLTHLVARRAPDGTVDDFFIADVDITHLRISEEQRLGSERQLRETLIREVHHRVKNGLQGVIGMMRLHASSHPLVAEAINQAVAQLMAISVAFGLAGRHSMSKILLCDLVLDIARNVEQISRRSIEVTLSPAAVRRPVALAESHGVNVSVVINELISNAVKHGGAANGSNGVKIHVDRDDVSATLQVFNESGKLPLGFSIENGSRLGTGLSLVKVLMPPEACELTIGPKGEGVQAQLRLTSPVLSLSEVTIP